MTVTPRPLMGATVVVGSDRYAATIVHAGDKQVGIIYDQAIRTDNNGPCTENQHYQYKPQAIEKGIGRSMEFFTLRHNGQWVRKGEGWRNGTKLIVGVRDHYVDPSF